ncbi:hypothetical protein EHP00_175 [Ecytonucleospora hepatopenaei]|uniref:Uncharacterized protein n=1 Tax=Ecytonucleospora hepatopenaei TaxID=646526 RepID=A0A1W0E6E2_9MICR|nr:hypothetical protein EHP00_175 [Ecytonucleospora hepatopenaei]
MSDENNIIGLKIDKGEVLVVMSDDPNNFKIASTNLISKVEEILCKLSNRETWPQKSKKENIIFEIEKNIGSGVFRDYYDKDGDKTFHFEAKVTEKPEIDEDKAFGLSESNKVDNSPIIKESPVEEEAINHWGASTEETTNDKTLNKFTPPYVFEKRTKINNKTDEISNLRDDIIRMLLRNSFLPKQTFQVSKTKKVDKEFMVKHISNKKSFKQEGFDGNFCINIFKFSVKKSVKNVKESLFYLNTA